MLPGGNHMAKNVLTLIKYTKKIYASETDKPLSRIKAESKLLGFLWSPVHLMIWNGFDFVEREFSIKELSKVRAAYLYQDTKTLVLEIF
jgi:hypothetical protein